MIWNPSLNSAIWLLREGVEHVGSGLLGLLGGFLGGRHGGGEEMHGQTARTRL